MEEEAVVADSVEETPSPETTQDTVVPEKESEGEVSTTPETTLYDLPDGRKVDAETLQKEWKENFLPDYTKKSQELAEYKRSKEETVPDWKKPEYVPASYDELIEKGAELALSRLSQQQREAAEREAEVAKQVDQQIAEIRKVNPKLDENALFHHANKYGFRDLKLAHENMQVIKNAELQAEQRTLKNLKSKIDPVGVQGAMAMGGEDIEPTTSGFGSALEYFRSLKG